jgi:Aspartyl protease
MTKTFAVRILIITFGLVLLSSCASENVSQSKFTPAAIAMNKEAGRGGPLIVSINLIDGGSFPFVLDTGCALTCLDKSLEPHLGLRIGKLNMSLEGEKYTGKLYQAPRLYLGDTLLVKTTPYVGIFDCSKISSELGVPVMGILGMDVLRHYCIQLDFAANRIRFLNDTNADKTSWGKPFTLIDVGDGCFAIQGNLAGVNGSESLIDTGCVNEGWLIPQAFEQWTHQFTTPTNYETFATNAVLEEEIYPDVTLYALDAFSDGRSSIEFNGIGLRFLSRHLVTLDFPEKIMYLKRTSIGPFIDGDMKATAEIEGSSALQFLGDLKEKGQLPGWAKDDKRATDMANYTFWYPDFVELNLMKKGDGSIYHYDCTRSTKKASWKLERAWRTKANGETIEEYPVM